MQWSKIKSNVTAHVFLYPEHEGSVEIIRQAGDKTISNYLDTVDIRSVARLRDLIPEAFPRSFRTGYLHVYTNNQGLWCVSTRKR